MEQDVQKKDVSKPRKRRIWKIVVTSVLLLTVVFAASVVGMTWHYMNKIQRPDDSASYMNEEEYASSVQQEEGKPNANLSEIDPDSVIWSDGNPLGLTGDVTNILLIGQDAREGEGRGRSDSIILCSINRTSGKICMVSFLRDLYVQIPGYQDNRINAAYAFGGAELLDQTIEKNFGLTIDANIEIDFGGFEAVIDALGGVDITLTDAEYEYFHENGQTYAVRGKNHFNGEQALFYARIRYLDSDFGRTSRQRTVLLSVFEKIRTASLSEMLSLADTLLPLMTVDLSNGEILRYVADFYPLLRTGTVDSFAIPADGMYTYASIREMSVIVPDLTVCRALLKERLSAN